MDKKLLIGQVQKAMRGEETATRAYVSHLRAIITRFEISPENLIKVKEIMDTMIRQDKAHREICERLLVYVKEQDRDDF